MSDTHDDSGFAKEGAEEQASQQSKSASEIEENVLQLQSNEEENKILPNASSVEAEIKGAELTEEVKDLVIEQEHKLKDQPEVLSVSKEPVVSTDENEKAVKLEVPEKNVEVTVSELGSTEQSIDHIPSRIEEPVKAEDIVCSNSKSTVHDTATPDTSDVSKVEEKVESETESVSEGLATEAQIVGSPTGETQKEIQNDADTGSSDYDTVDEDDHGGNEDEDLAGDEEEDEELADGEREEGDGEESVPAKPLDDDEDKRNPQYIPKKGGFYEHDDRTMEEVTEEAKEPEPEKPKKVWRADTTDRWTHDRFDPDEQAPKKDGELTDVYGYDIRKEEGAPRARRRRRYGRGPNKYDRTWEDTEAYSKPRGRGGRGGGGRGGGRGGINDSNPEFANSNTDFPALIEQHEGTASLPKIEAQKQHQTMEPSFGRPIMGRSENVAAPVAAETKEYRENKEFSDKREQKSFVRDQEGPYRGRGLSFKRGGRGRGVERREFKRDENDMDKPGKPELNTEVKGRGSGRIFRGPEQIPTQLPPASRGRGRGRGTLPYSADDDELNGELGYLKMEDKNDNRSRAGSGRIQAHMPPRMQDTSRTKRYSTQRQRTVPDSAGSMPLSQNAPSPPIPSALPPRPFAPPNVQGAYFDPSSSYQVSMYPDSHSSINMHQGMPGQQYAGPAYAPPPPNNIYVPSNAYAAGPGNYSVPGYAPPQGVPIPMGLDSQVCYNAQPYI